MKTNAHRTLRISLAALLLLFLFADLGFSAQKHTVQKGDTLFKIAHKYGTTVSALQNLNNLNSNSTLKVGQTINIQKNSSSGTSSGKPVVYGITKVDDVEVWNDNELIATFPGDTRFTVLFRKEDKYKVELENGDTGWVLAECIKLHDTRKPVVSDSRKPMVSDAGKPHGDIISTALSYRGSRYVRGGMTSRGFDCSGFVKYIYAKKGINLPHSSAAQYHHGKPVDEANLQPGDVVFFKGTYRSGISHVGIYIGDGKFIHASTSRTGVKVDELDSPYYRKRYAGARRM